MKTPKPIFLLCLLAMQLTLSAQVQWYQNQDGNNEQPYGTIATTVQPFSSTTFIACYLWHTENELNTWKISKSNSNGTELKTFFITATSATVEFKVGRNNAVYVFERSFTPDYSPRYIMYKLDANLNVTAQRSIELPNGFVIYNAGAFEIDKANNVYVTGDGQYINAAGGTSPASFVLKQNKNLVDVWRKVDSIETAYTRLHIDRWGRVLVLEDYYANFPVVHIKRFAYNGQRLATFTITTDPGRYSVSTALDEDDNILLYGGKTNNGTSQALYLKKISRVTGNVVYSKTLFETSSFQLNDLKLDPNGNIFTLVTQYSATGEQKCRISRINPANGNIAWNRNMNFSEDSCDLTRLVMNSSDKFYAIGEKRSCNYFTKGFAIRIKKNGGQLDGNFPAPDSVAFHRSHWLSDGITDNNNRLIAIGSTYDFDSITYSSTYFRSFALRMGGSNNCYGKGEEETLTEEEEATPEIDRLELAAKVALYPNPASNQLTVYNINTDEYSLLTVYNMQGALIQQQKINTDITRLDISNLANGVYLLVLRSSSSLIKEKSIKFVVRK